MLCVPCQGFARDRSGDITLSGGSWQKSVLDTPTRDSILATPVIDTDAHISPPRTGSSFSKFLK